MRLRRTWPAAVLLLAPVLAACSDDADSTPDDDTSSSAPAPSETPSSAPASTPSETEETTTAPPASSLPAACDLITADDLAKAMGVTFAPGRAGTGDTTEQDLSWTSDDCSFEAEDLVEVTVKLTGPDDFTQGRFGCPQPPEVGSIIDPADDIAGATDGWWKVSDAPPLEATLRACSATALVDVEMEYEDGVDYEGDPRAQAAQLAEFVLANLQG